MNIKKYLNIALLLTIVIVLGFSSYKTIHNIKKLMIDENINQARMMTNQLLATRHYLASIAQKVKVIDDNISPFSLSPAYVGGQISDDLYKNSNYYIKQTSLRYRNIKNKPDDYEKMILKKYENKEISGEHSQITTVNDENYLRYTYPLYIKKECLACHGTPYKDIKKETYEKLTKIYGNRSFNYKLDDLRGMISISVKVNSIRQMADRIINSVTFKTILLGFLIGIILFIERKYVTNPQLEEINKKAQSEKEFKKYLNIVIESNDNAIIAVDKNRTIMTYNNKAQEIFGFTKEEMIGTNNLLNIIPLKYKNLHEVASAMYFRTGKSKGIIGKTLELEGLRKNGDIFPIRISFGANDDKNNMIVVANIDDITLEKQKQELNDNLEMEITSRIGEIYALNQEIEATQAEIIFTMGEIGESRSKETGLHVKRVAKYSALLAKLYGLKDKDIEIIELVSPMHDIGKIGIADNILHKTSKLNSEEFEIMKKHTTLGYNMLKNSKRELLKSAAIVAYQHHERWDGKGYPQGLKEEQIHIFGRITAIVDVFDALGSKRSYKDAWSDDKIIAFLIENKAKHFDPKLVDLFIEYKDSFFKLRDKYQEKI
jgi:PAS domain S-box-containing protein